MTRGPATRALLAFLGSQILNAGLAPVSLAAPAGGLTAARPAPAAPSLVSPQGAAALAKRRELDRSFPHRIGRPGTEPLVSRRRPPLLAREGGRVVRTRAFTGAPETLRVLGLRIDFERDSLSSQTSTPDGRFDLRPNGQALGIVIDPPPHNRTYFRSHLEALARYWKFTSYGNLVLEYEVYPLAENGSYRLSDTGAYGPWTLGQESFDEAARFFHDAVRTADQTDSIPFGDFDVLALFHAGADFQSDIRGDSPRDFPTFQINLEDSVLVNGGAVAIRGGLVMPETENQDGSYAAINGTLAHEFGHTQGLFDLYDINTLYPGVGVWSNMDSGYLLGTRVQDAVTLAEVDASGILPTSLDPWSKSLLWPTQLDYVDPGRSLTTSLRATQLSDRLLLVPLGGEEYYLIENRQFDLNGDNTIFLDRDSTSHVILGPGLATTLPSDSLGDKEFDFLLPGQGILVWHVDQSVIYGRHIPPDFGINSNPARRGVRLLEADGIADLGDPFSLYWYGSPFDPYFVGNHTQIGPDTNPSSRTNDGADSHVSVDVLSPPGLDMTLAVVSEWRAEGWPVPSSVSHRGAAPTHGSLRHDGRRSVLTAADSLILAWMADGEPYYTEALDGVFAKLPASVRTPILFADSLFRRNPSARHDAAVVATCDDGLVHALRANARDSTASIPLFGWPPELVPGSSILATTTPVLDPGGPGDPSGNVLVGGSDGRVYAIIPSDSVTVAPRVEALTDTFRVGSTTIVAPVVGTMAVGRFRGAGGYQIAYALETGLIRVAGPDPKDPSRLDQYWTLPPTFGFAPVLLGLDVDRAADRDLELVIAEASRGAVHCFDLDGFELPGWPVATAAPLSGPIAAGDLDGDGYPEVFGMDRDGGLHRWNRNGIEPIGWPVSMKARFGSEAAGGSGSPILGDVDGDGRADVVVGLDNGLLVALDALGRTLAGWPLSIQGGASSTPLLLSLNDAAVPPDPSGAAWTHLVIGGDDDGVMHAYQLPARADSALFTTDAVSLRTPWHGLHGNRRHTSVLEDTELPPLAAAGRLLEGGSVYCFPNPSRGGAPVGLAYTLGPGVTRVSIRVLDPLGNEVDQVAGSVLPAQNVTRIPVSKLRSGVYLVRLEVEGGQVGEVVFDKFAVVK